jgi:hypothetical protein
LAQSGYTQLHRTCPLSEAKRTYSSPPASARWVCLGGEGNAGLRNKKSRNVDEALRLFIWSSQLFLLLLLPWLRVALLATLSRILLLLTRLRILLAALVLLAALIWIAHLIASIGVSVYASGALAHLSHRRQ